MNGINSTFWCTFYYSFNVYLWSWSTTPAACAYPQSRSNTPFKSSFPFPPVYTYVISRIAGRSFTESLGRADGHRSPDGNLAEHTNPIEAAAGPIPPHPRRHMTYTLVRSVHGYGGPPVRGSATEPGASITSSVPHAGHRGLALKRDPIVWQTGQ